eukprot:CAMPEP_0171107088 /NCGR_PEP_ID=MMETSP0766_2-20121228/66140_1 /TAXON_ID=439317 /ORGANISM="Gambierdiscus australes, Strain CAWD 149" /LENGTH=251 /DNA_ID=CAMNT_0011568327 /DNA_START=100 /DNA_END=851 /DNA_ORIENTATION=+
MGKKAGGGVKMSLNDLSVKFGGDPQAGKLPTHSEGKDFGKGKGKGGLRDFEESRAEQNEWRGGGKGDREGGKGFRGRDRDQGDSRADTGDWLAKDRPFRGDDRGDDRGGRFGGGGGGFPRRDADRRGGDDTIAEKDSDWRGGMGRQRERDDDDRRGGFGGRGRGGGDDEWRREGNRNETESQRPRLNLKPRTKPLPGDSERTPAHREDDDVEARRGGGQRQRSDPFGGARPREDAEAAPKAAKGGEAEGRP